MKCYHWDVDTQQTRAGFLFFCKACGKSFLFPEYEIKCRLDGDDNESEQGARVKPRTPGGGEGQGGWTACAEATVEWELERVS